MKIPAGVKDGARIRLAGKGEPGGAGGAPGDLFVKVQVTRHPVFGRRRRPDGRPADQRTRRRRWARKVEVPTLNGPVKLKIPAGTPSGKTFRVQGARRASKGGHGDLLAKVRVDVPEKLSREEKDLLKQLREASGGLAPEAAGGELR